MKSAAEAEKASEPAAKTQEEAKAVDVTNDEEVLQVEEVKAEDAEAEQKKPEATLEEKGDSVVDGLGSAE